ncbi:hypothetical protein Bbelb_143630 [Branchiostoma belcheri]|nr:hypothetical protein Bbelb_143630 [Branchiostoma belcheri]
MAFHRPDGFGSTLFDFLGSRPKAHWTQNILVSLGLALVEEAAVPSVNEGSSVEALSVQCRLMTDQGWLNPLSHIQNLPRTPADQGWLKPLSHIQNLPPNTSRPRTFPRTLADQGWLKPLSHILNLPPNISRPRLAEAPVTHSEPSPEHKPTKNLPPNTSRPRLAEAPVTHSEPSPEHKPTKVEGGTRWWERGVKEAIYERMYNPTLNREGGLRVDLSGTWDLALPAPRTDNT